MNPQRVSVTALFERFCMDEREMYKSTPEGMFRNTRLKGTSRSRENTSLSDQSISSSSNLSVFERGKSTTDDALTRDSVVALCRKYCDEDQNPTETPSSDKNSNCASPDSELASTTTQLLFVDPRSDRTSLGDIYEPCFAINPVPKRPSIRRQWNFSSLDLRLIDEDTNPTCSPDPLDSESIAPVGTTDIDGATELGPEVSKSTPPPSPLRSFSPLPIDVSKKVEEKGVMLEKRNSIAKIRAHKRSKCFPL